MADLKVGTSKPGSNGGICSIEGCGRPFHAHGWCNQHYRRWKKAGDAQASNPIEERGRVGCSIDGCDKPHHARGWCVNHYQRWLENGDVCGDIPIQTRIFGDAEKKFWSAVEVKIGGCWIWTGSDNGDRYPHICTGNGKKEHAHRWAYRTFVGPIPEGYVVDHICHNADESCIDWSSCPHRRCVNPAHLEAVPQHVNVARGHGHGSETHCPRGHAYRGDNLRITPRGHRKCKTCERLRYTQLKAARVNND